MVSKVNLRSFNLNTLPILWEILRQGGVGKAAKTLHVSQPALSAALKKLRIQFDDELIFRSNGSMKLTVKAEALLAPLEKAILAVQDVVAQNNNSDDRLCKIACSDHLMITFGEPLTKYLLGGNLNIKPAFVVINPMRARNLSDGDIDCLIIPKSILLDHHLNGNETKLLKSAPLYSEALVGIANRNDLTVVKGLTVQEYLDRPQISFIVDSDRNMAIQQAFLASNNFKQNEIARFSSYSALLPIIESTDCISLVPAGFAKEAMKRFDIQTFVPPIDFPSLDWVMVWHQRSDQDTEFAKLRDFFRSIALKVNERTHERE